MSLDHEAIYKAYAGTVVTIDDGTGAFDKDGKSVTLEQSKIDAARTTINAEYAALEYSRNRAATLDNQPYNTLGSSTLTVMEISG